MDGYVPRERVFLALLRSSRLAKLTADHTCIHAGPRRRYLTIYLHYICIYIYNLHRTSSNMSPKSFFIPSSCTTLPQAKPATSSHYCREELLDSRILKAGFHEPSSHPDFLWTLSWATTRSILCSDMTKVPEPSNSAAASGWTVSGRCQSPD